MLWVIPRKIHVVNKSSFSEDNLCYCRERQRLMFLRWVSVKKGTLTYSLGPEKPSWVLEIISLSLKDESSGPSSVGAGAEGVGLPFRSRGQAG